MVGVEPTITQRQQLAGANKRRVAVPTFQAPPRTLAWVSWCPCSILPVALAVTIIRQLPARRREQGVGQPSPRSASCTRPARVMSLGWALAHLEKSEQGVSRGDLVTVTHDLQLADC